jgi:hypothetical protein
MCDRVLPTTSTARQRASQTLIHTQTKKKKKGYFFVSKMQSSFAIEATLNNLLTSRQWTDESATLKQTQKGKRQKKNQKIKIQSINYFSPFFFSN